MEEYVSHIQGSKENYNPSTMQGGIFFSKDTKEILLNGDNYGGHPADEEDITAENGNLKLKDRVYDEENFSGKGYVILRKNIQEGRNILTQEMINQANTIYEIRYDFDLNEQTITIPQNCVLRFNGGSFQEGILKINNNTKVYSTQIRELTNVVLNICGSNVQLLRLILSNSTQKLDDNYSTIYLSSNNPISNFLIQDCVIVSTIGNGITLDNMSGVITTNIQIMHNDIKFNRMGVEMLDHSGSNRWLLTNICIKDNNIHYDDNSGRYRSPISISGYSRYSYIINNRLYGNYNEINGADKIYFIGNKVYVAGNDSQTSNRSSGFLSQYGSGKISQTEIVLKENIFYDSGIVISNANNVQIVDNIINEHSNLISIKDLLIQSNFIHYSYDAALTLLNCINATVINNTVTNSIFFDTDSNTRYHIFAVEYRANQDWEIDSLQNIYIDSNYVYDDYQAITQYDRYFGCNLINCTTEEVYIGTLHDLKNQKIYRYSSPFLVSSDYGETLKRPDNVNQGFQYFDTDLNKPVYWNGTEWVDPTESIEWAVIE